MGEMFQVYAFGTERFKKNGLQVFNQVIEKTTSYLKLFQMSYKTHHSRQTA